MPSGHRPDAMVLWLDAHGDYNTPGTSGSGYLGGMCLAAATGEWDAGLGDAVPAERVVLAGIRDLDAGERLLLEQSPATVIGASTVETLVAAKNALDFLRSQLSLAFTTEDIQEGVKAFFEKRAPQWTGR